MNPLSELGKLAGVVGRTGLSAWRWARGLLPKWQTSCALLSLGAAVGAVAYTSPSFHMGGGADAVGVFGGIAVGAAFGALLLVYLVFFERIADSTRDWFEAIGEDKRLIAAVIIGLGWALAFVVGMSAHGQDREGQGVWEKVRCIEPSAALPIQGFVPPGSTSTKAVADTAARYVGVTEQPPGSNEGPAVEKFLSSVGLGPGYAWCAAAASYWYEAACMRGPTRSDGTPIRSAGAAKFLNANGVIDAAEVRRGQKTVPIGYGVAWKYPHDWRGHKGVVAGDENDPDGPWRGSCGLTIEGNTSAPS